MQGATASTPRLIAACTTGVAKSTSQVVKMILAPWPSRLTAHALAVVGLLFCVSHVLIARCRLPTPPFALICLTRIRAAASAGSSNGAIWPFESKAHPITIGPFASVAARPPVAPAIAATATAAPRSITRPLHLVVLFTAPPLVSPAPAVVELTTVLLDLRLLRTRSRG